MKQLLQDSLPRTSIWSYRDMRLVLPARSLSFFGDSVAFILLSLKLAESGEPAVMTALFICFSLPLFALASVAGRLVDEYDSRTLLVAAGMLQVVASLGLVWSPNLWTILGFVVLLQAGQAVTATAWTVLVPRIVGDELISRAVGLQQSLAGLAGLAGAALGGLLYQVLGFHITMLIDTLSFAMLAMTALLVRTRRGRRYDARADVGQPTRPGVDHTPESGFHFVTHDPLLRLLLPALMLFVLSVEGTNVVEVFLIRDDFGASAAMFGVVIAGFMVGQIIGPLLGGRVATDSLRVSLSALAAAVIGGLLIAIGLAPGVWLVVPLFVVCGVAGGALNSMLGALTLRRSPESMRGRVTALITGAARGCSVLAMVLGGIAGQLLGARTTFVVGGVLAVLVALMVRSSRRGLDLPTRLADERIPEPVA